MNFTIYYKFYIVELIITNYQKVEIVRIKRYREEKNDFNYDGKSRANAISAMSESDIIC